MKTKTEVQQPVQTEERTNYPTCECCKLSHIAGDDVTFRGETGYTIARGVAVCSFCKMLFPSIVPPAVDLSDLELMGAWAGLSEDIAHYHNNVSHDMLRQRLALDRMLPEVFQSWLLDSAVQTKAEEEYYTAVMPVHARTRILQAIETACIIADDRDHEWNVDLVKEAITDAEVAPVWASWLGSHHRYGKSPAKDGQSHWARSGEYFIQSSYEWSAKCALHAAKRKVGLKQD